MPMFSFIYLLIFHKQEKDAYFFIYLLFISQLVILRAFTVDVRYVPNVKYLAHISHQTQKIGF